MATREAPIASGIVALISVEGRCIGIAGEHVVGAVMVPEHMARMPRRDAAVAGVVVHAGRPLPVVRLQPWLGSCPPGDADAGSGHDAAPSPADARIVLLRDGGVTVGLLADAVLGVKRCPPGAVTRLCHDDDPEELFASAALLDAGGPPTVLLEPARLVALAGAWVAADEGLLPVPETAGPAESVAATGTGRPVHFGVFRIGDARVGLAADDIGELLRVPALRPPPVPNPAVRGLCDWRGRLLPVMDLAPALGACPDPQGPGWLCVVRHGALSLGVLVHEVMGLRAIEGLVPGDPARLVRQEVSTDGGILQVVDTAALMAACPEAKISEPRGGDTRVAARDTCPDAYLVFEAAGRHAARIEGVQEVVPLPSELRARRDAGLPVSLSWRGHAVPVRDLFAETGLCPAPGEERQLIILAVGERRAAIPIAGLKAMIPANTATRSRMRVGTRVVDVVSTAAGAERPATYAVVDLTARV